MKKQLFALFSVLTLATSMTAVAADEVSPETAPADDGISSEAPAVDEDAPAEEDSIRSVTLYQNINYQGAALRITRDGCTVVPQGGPRPLSANAASDSVVKLFEANSCTGRYIVLRPGTGVPDVRRQGLRWIGAVHIQP